MYIHINITYQVIENPIQMCNSECLWIKIKNFDAKFTLGVVYRHPRTQTADQFLEDFFKSFDSLNKILNTIIIWVTSISLWKLKKIFLFQCAI